MAILEKYKFDLISFDMVWDSLDEQARFELVSNVTSLDPDLAILPVVQGLLSYHFKLRSKSREQLDRIVKQVSGLLEQDDDPATHEAGLRESARVAASLYHQVRPEMEFNEQSYFFRNLLDLGEQGAYFALKAMLKGSISLENMKKVLYTATDPQRLNFVDQYLRISPAVRLRYGREFRIILGRLSSRQPVVRYYASLFDRGQDADPFLGNINFDLRDPQKVLEKEVASSSPGIKIIGLKALAMMRDRIPWQILADTIKDQDVKKLRLTVYQIVENSAVGIYPEMFDPLWNQLEQCDAFEGLCVFKALVVTGKMPCHALMDLIRKDHPELLPGIHEEMATLNRISFFFVQDIALNKDRYLSKNFDINLACILGMIKKRPERVVRIMKDYSETVKKPFAPDFEKFMEKTRQLLKKERLDIEDPGKKIDRMVEQNKTQGSKGLFHSILKPSPGKKIDALRQNQVQDNLELAGQMIQGEDLSDKTFMSARIFFNRTVFRECRLSGTYFGNACFKGCIFINVNLDGAHFDTTSFDQAVFINVSARGAVFDNCSFQEATLFDSDFSRAKLVDAVLIGAQITKTAFDLCRLEYACFAHSRISAVSFMSAYLDHVDFFKARARFSRFPSYLRSLFRSRDVEYNARRYQLSLKDLPQIEKSYVYEINQLIFCEFIHHGEMMFFKQNRLSLLTAFDIFRPSQADFFQIVPLLFHENIEFIGSGPLDPRTPCGIADYLPTDQTGKILEKIIGKDRFKLRRSRHPWIEGIFTMGSVGSLAQTSESDIDYWICINEDLMTADEIRLLRRKMAYLEKAALDRFKIHVTFFLVDTLKAKNNDFGGSTQESSGSAQSRLLKEEFYRTMIHVAGRLPLWSVLPTAISLNYYHLIHVRVSGLASMSRYIDLGDIHAIPVNEYFGASIWQMFKWLKSPFKSIIKMALLEKYIASYGKELLLCNQYKNEWMNSGIHLKVAQNDSYIILLNHLLAFYAKTGDEKSKNLILTCFFLKLAVSKKSTVDATPLGLRKILLEKCLADWSWEEAKLFDIGKFREWKYAWVYRLSTTLEKYMVAKYNKVKQEFKSRSQGLMISRSDRTVLERKVQIEFQDKPFKIKKLLLVSRSHRHFPRLHIRYCKDPSALGRWELLYSDSKTDKSDAEPLVRSDAIEEIGAWMINNRLFTDRTVISLVPNPTPITHNDIQRLYDAMKEFFAEGLNRTTRFEELERTDPVILSMFVSLNFYNRHLKGRIADYCAVYLNAWGEMFFRTNEIGKSFPDLDQAKKDMLSRVGLKSFPLNTQFYFARGG